MVEEELKGDIAASPYRRRRDAAERRLIVKETCEADTSMAHMVPKYGMKANLLFQYRRLYRDGHLATQPQTGMLLFPVGVVEENETAKSAPIADAPVSAGVIHVELRGEVRISFER